MAKSAQHEEEYLLIEKILEGKQDLYKILVERYSSMVFHVVRRFEKDSDEVEELAQEIFVKAYEKLRQFNENSKFSTWLYTIAMNHCRDYAKNVRRKNHRISEMDSGFLDSNYTEQQTPHLKMEIKEWGQLLMKSLIQLSDDYSEPFLMKYRDGMSYKTMSEETGVSESALKVRVHRARKELKILLENEVQS